MGEGFGGLPAWRFLRQFHPLASPGTLPAVMHVYVILAVVAFCAATISAIIGMGGGILLLATMFCFM
ncbi:MAG: hypothetical protein KJ749_07400, partial [Planctomycetes bacterium]|nr:hypothetical protein [Planctomycetota bacterium]